MLLSRIAEELHAGMPQRDAEIPDIAYDSRKATENTMFVCLSGARTDGHMFAKNKVLLSVVFYVGISFLFSMLTSGYGFAWAEAFSGQHVMTEASVDVLRVMSVALWHAVVIALIQSAVMYLATVFSLKKGLNLA